MSLWVLTIVLGGIAIFYTIGFLPEMKRWHRKKKSIGSEYEEGIKPKGKAKLSIFGITLRRE